MRCAEHYYGHTALADLRGIADDKIYDNRLCRTLDKLLPHKEALEKHLKERYCVSQPDTHQRILLQRLGLQIPSRLTKNHKM